MAKPENNIKHILEAETQAMGVFRPKWDEARRNAEILGLKLWTEKERKKIEDQNRIAYNLDRVNHAINTLLGAQRETRTDIFFQGQAADDELRVELYNAVWKHFSDLYQFMHIESDVFVDGLVAKYGAYGCEMDYRKNPLGDLRPHRIPFDEVMWDTNSREYDLTDAHWMSRKRFYQRDELLSRYPEKEEIIQMAGNDWSWFTPKNVKELWYKKEKDLIGVSEFYEKDTPTRYFIWQAGADVVLPEAFESRRKAEERIREFGEMFQQMVFKGEADPNQPPKFEVEGIPTQVVSKTVATMNGELEEKHVFEMGEFPISIYFPYYYDGDFWGAVDRVKDPQRFESRMFAQIDHWISAMAKGLLRLDPKVPEPERKKIAEQWGKTGGTFTAKADSVELIQGAGPAPQLFVLLDKVDVLMKETFGGANALGLKQSSSESGRAVLARLGQAGLDNLIPLDNLRRTKHNLGTKVAWYLSNRITAPRVLRLTGDDLTMQAMNDGRLGEYFSASTSRPNVGYLKVNSEKKNTITGLEVDIVVDEAQHSATKNMQMLNQLTDFGKTGLLTVPPPPEVIIELLPIPLSLKQAWKQAAAQQAQSVEPEMQVSTNYKDLPPEAQTQVLEKQGIETSTEQATDKQMFDTDKPQLTDKEKASAGKN